MRHRPAPRTLLRAAGALAGGLLTTTPLASTTPATAAPPRAVVVPCGAVLTTSVRLAADVVCPGGEGLTLAADGIELNLNGHSVTGPGADAAAGTVGVRVRARDVVVRGGTVRGWTTGVLSGTHYVEEAPEGDVGGLVREVRLQANTTGVVSRAESSLTVRASRISGNGLGGHAWGRGRLLVEGSTVDANGTGFTAFEVEDGGFVLRGSTVRDSRGTAVSCDQDAVVVVERSTLQRNGAGVDAFLCSARIEDSALRWNGRHFASLHLVDHDRIEVTCTSFSRDGGPLPFEAEPCAAAGRVSGTVQPLTGLPG